MDLLHIRVSDDTIAIESGRPPEKIGYDDFLWCVGATFSFQDGSLVIETPLFGFLLKLLHVIRDTAIGSSTQVNDEYGSYRLKIDREADHLTVFDEFSGNSAHLPLPALVSNIEEEFELKTAELENLLPAFLTNESYLAVKREVQKHIGEGSVFDFTQPVEE